jgi:hypothetical protein
MLFFPVFAKLQRRIVPPAQLGDRLAVSRLAFSALPVIQPLSFQMLTDSFAPWVHNNHFVINTLRTLSIAIGVYTPLLHISSLLAIDPVALSLLESYRLQTITHQPLSNHIVTKTMGGRGVSRKDRATRQQSRKLHARDEQRLRGGRCRPPAASSQRGAAPPGNTARREDGRWREAKSPA